MRKLILFFATFVAVQTFAQAPPQAFSYSGIARSNGQPLVNHTINLELSIIENTPIGPVVYTETQTTTTDTAGYFSVAMGFGTPTLGTFSSITWGNGNHYLSVGIDTTGGNNFTNLGTTQLLSVPYALYSGSSASAPYERILYTYHTLGVDTNFQVSVHYDSLQGHNTYDTSGIYIYPQDTTIVNSLEAYAELSTYRNGDIILSFVGYGYVYKFKLVPNGGSLTFIPLFQTGQYTLTSYGCPISYNRTWSASGNFNNGKVILSTISIDTEVIESNNGTGSCGGNNNHIIIHETFFNFINQ